MAHFAKLGINGKVIAVHVVHNSDVLNSNGQEDEKVGQRFLEKLHGWPKSMWIQTSYNTRNGIHLEGKTPLRGNYAGLGMMYDEDNNIFRARKQPYPSWTLNTTTAQWEPPTPEPSTMTVDEVAESYTWNESTKVWDKVVA